MTRVCLFAFDASLPSSLLGRGEANIKGSEA
jgi:hypothetical protein